MQIFKVNVKVVRVLLSTSFVFFPDVSFIAVESPFAYFPFFKEFISERILHNVADRILDYLCIEKESGVIPTRFIIPCNRSLSRCL